MAGAFVGAGVLVCPLTCFFLRLLSSITQLMPSIVQLEHVTVPSDVMWYLCITSHLTLRERHAAHAFAALLLTGLGLPLASSAALVLFLFFPPESVELAGECISLGESAFSVLITTAAGILRRFLAACDTRAVTFLVLLSYPKSKSFNGV